MSNNGLSGVTPPHIALRLSSTSTLQCIIAAHLYLLTRWVLQMWLCTIHFSTTWTQSIPAAHSANGICCCLVFQTVHSTHQLHHTRCTIQPEDDQDICWHHGTPKALTLLSCSRDQDSGYHPAARPPYRLPRGPQYSIWPSSMHASHLSSPTHLFCIMPCSMCHCNPYRAHLGVYQFIDGRQCLCCCQCHIPAVALIHCRLEQPSIHTGP